MTAAADPHRGQPVATAGVPLGRGRTVMIMVHGRNAGPANILSLVPQLVPFQLIAPNGPGASLQPTPGFVGRSLLAEQVGTALDHSDVTYLAPAAAGGTWYPFSFMADRERNEPALTSALGAIDELVRKVTAHGIPKHRLILLGFSQGACLTAEFAIRHADRYGGIIVYSGGLIGAPGTTWTYPGGFAGTPVFFGCSDVDGHVPKSRVDESADVFARMGAVVTKRIYPGMGHLVNEDEIAFTKNLMHAMLVERA